MLIRSCRTKTHKFSDYRKAGRTMPKQCVQTRRIMLHPFTPLQHDKFTLELVFKRDLREPPPEKLQNFSVTMPPDSCCDKKVLRLFLKSQVQNCEKKRVVDIFYQKNPRVRKICVRNSGAGNGCANFMGAWKNALFLQEKPCP